MHPATCQLTTHSSHLLIFTSLNPFIFPPSSLIHSTSKSLNPLLCSISWCSSQKLDTMQSKRSHVSLTMLALLVVLLSQNLVIIPVMSSTVGEQKNYHTPDPHAGKPPTGFSDSLCNSLTQS